MALDAASNGNFSTNTEEEALQKIENLAASDNNQFTEYDRTSRSAPADTRRMEELISKMEQLVKKESRAPVHMCEGESSGQNDEEVFQAEMNYINGQGQGNRGFNPNLRYNNNLSYRSNNVENPQDQYYPPQRNTQQFQQRPYEQKSGNFNQGRFQQSNMNQGRSSYQQPYQAPPADKLDEIKNLVQHFTKTFDEKLNAMARTIDEFSTEHREKFEVMQNQIRNVENQIAQTAAAVQRPAGTLPGRPDQNPRDNGKNFCSFVRKPDAEQQEEDYWDEVLTNEYLEENFGERYLPEGEELMEETEEEILSIEAYTTPVRTLNSFSETLVDEIFYVYTEEFVEHSAQPIQTQLRSDREQIAVSKLVLSRMVDMLKKEIDHPRINERLHEYRGLILSILYGRFAFEDVERIIVRDYYDKKDTSGPSLKINTEESVEDRDRERILREILGPKNSEPLVIPTIVVNEEEAREMLEKLMKRVRPLVTEQDLFHDITVVQDMVCGLIKVEKAAVVIMDGYFRRREKVEIARKEDPGKFVIPVSIGEANFRGLCDLGSNISIMPEDTFKSLNIGRMEGRKSLLIMANGSSTESGGIIRNVPVGVGKFKFLTDFIILKYDHEPPDTILLGRDFLLTSGALIDTLRDEIHLRAEGETLIFNMKEERAHEDMMDSLEIAQRERTPEDDRKALEGREPP